jgi:large subunit ribosomal protein L31e
MEQDDKKEADIKKEQETTAEPPEEQELEELLKETQEKEETTEETLEETAEIQPAEEEAAVLEKEEEKAEAPAREKAREEEEIVEERFYTVPLGRANIMPQRKRTARAMRMLKTFLNKHMKLEPHKTIEGEEEEEPKQLIISNEVNEHIWRKGIEKPPRKIRVRATKDKEGNVTVHLAEGD